MCFDTKSSLLSWIISITIAIYLYKRNRKFDRWNFYFIITFSSIQLLEAAIHAGFDKDRIVSLILVMLLLQPLVQNLGCYSYLKSENDTSSSIIKPFLYLYVVLLAYIYIFSLRNKFTSYKGENGHLVWEVVSSNNENKNLMSTPIQYLYLFGLFFPLLFMGQTGYILITVGVLTALYSYLTSSGKEFSSMWCFTSVIYSIVCIFL